MLISFWQGSQDQPQACDSQEGLTGLRKAVLLIVLVYYRERVQIKISKGKERTGKVWEKPGTDFLMSFPVKLYRDTLNTSSNDV